MWPIFIKEIKTVFDDVIGFVAIGLFLIINTLFLWVISSSFNIIQSGFADLTLFFELAPWLLIIVIPALSMRSFSEEIKTGTLELLLSKPVSIGSIVWGKFFAIFFVGFLALLPTLSYIYFVHLLLPDKTTLDKGMLLGGYIGLLLFLAMLAALGVFVSSLSRQQTTAFLVSLFLGFGHFYLWGQLANSLPSFFWYKWVSNMGMQEHYTSINRGILSTGDLSYFIGGTVFILVLTQYRIQKLQAQ